LFATLAEKERVMIAVRTRAALAAAKARGVKLGGPKLRAARKAALARIERWLTGTRQMSFRLSAKSNGQARKRFGNSRRR
jgi:Ni,Fe-hydrogenase III large subunit